ncbi:hypothetical protein CLV30_12648 [Haloactinopolyspora alba]|uniref:Integral membrane protein n=1 Tax=Haloactinopolyspora alba TaxID=648780 RepID=A0A2P8DGS6_9ACTN|nr:hypothetical protein [Haloactinopolyspora alba]PSK96389.1 hypothetical protein CLV30_12648 [Haloactinopolyspora alba]
MDHTDRDDHSIDTGLGGHTELRVHGVSGSAPEDVLDHPLLKRVAGDDRAGFHRRWYPGGRSADLDADRRLEAYRWSELTSGHAARAAWLLLLPFMLANAAHWMLPGSRQTTGPQPQPAGRVAAAMLRLFALSLTLLLILTAGQAAVDLAAWQCGGYPRCASSSWLLAPVRDGWFSGPGGRVVAGAVVPALVVLAIGLLGRDHLRSGSATLRADADAPDAPLTWPRFWSGDPGARTLRAAHVAAASAALAAIVAWPATTLAASGVGRIVGITLCLCALAVLLAAAVVVVGRHEHVHSTVAAVQARRLALSLLALSAVYSMLDHGRWDPAGHLPGLRPAVTITVSVAAALVVLLAVAVVTRRPWARARDGFRPAMRGFAAPAVTAGALMIAAGFSAGLVYRFADLLGYAVIRQSTAAAAIRRTETAVGDESLSFEARRTAAEAQTPLILPPSLAWAGAAATGIIIAVVVVLGVVAVGAWRRLGPLMERVRREHGVAAGEREQQVRRVARAEVLATLTDGVGRVVARITLTAGGIVAAGLVYSIAVADSGRILEQSPWSAVTGFGTWVMGAFAIGLISLAWQTAQSPELRRTVGTLWDIGSFWPRAAHPMAPPSYGERAVPELAHRIRRLALSEPRARVVVSAHSQGSVLAAAAVLQLPDDAAARVALLTHGSPLRRFYARFYPAYVGPNALETLREHVDGRWRNLYRRTDPIGSWVLDPPGDEFRRVDRELRDPATLDQPVLGHAEYWDDPAYEPAVAGLFTTSSRWRASDSGPG